MAQEEQTPRSSNNSGGGGGGGGGGFSNNSSRSSRKLKHKKVPQRGLGVAQLEKIRIEEQKKKDVVVPTSVTIISPTNSSSSCLGNQAPTFRPPPPPPTAPVALPSITTTTTIPLPPPLPINFQSLIPSTDGLPPPNFNKPMNTSGGEIGWPGIPTPCRVAGGSGGGNWPKLWSGEYSFEMEKNHHNGVDHRGFAAGFPANIGFPYESNAPIWPHTNTMQRSQQFQHLCSSSMVNVSVGTSVSPSSSLLNFQIEPPSNQSYCGNNYPPLWPEEEKMVGMKRPYPFTLESVPIPSFHCKFPTSYVSPISKSDESASCSNGGIANGEPANPVFREGPLNSSPISEPNPKKVSDDNGTLTRDFLSLAPPQAAHSQSCSKQKLYHHSPCVNPHYGELPQFGTLPHQGHNKDTIQLYGRAVTNKQPFISFFPAAKTHMGQAGNSNCEARETVDLNLKL